MKGRALFAAIFVIVLTGAGLATAAYTGRPKIISIFPVNGAVSIPITTPIRWEFSRPMEHEAVINHIKLDPDIPGSFSWEKNVLSFVPDASWPGGQVLSISLEAGARAASWLSFPMQEIHWSFTTSAAFLAYLWPSDGPADLYALDPTTGMILRYTKNMAVLEFSASQDGLTLYFSAGNSQGGADIYMLERKAFDSSANGAYQPKKLADCGQAQCRAPVVSPDGNYLAYEGVKSEAQGNLGKASVILVRLGDMLPIPLGEATHETVQPNWSLQSWLAYYDRTSQSYEVFKPEINMYIQLPNQTGQPGCWNPNGESFVTPEIYYTQASANRETGTSHLIDYSITTGSAIDLSVLSDVEDVEGCFSPQGTMIAFSRKFLDEQDWTFGRQLWVMNSDGSNAHPLTDEPDFNHYDLAWSRDGSMLAYVRFNQSKLSDPPELWMVNRDGSNPVQLVIGGYSPVWIP